MKSGNYILFDRSINFSPPRAFHERFMSRYKQLSVSTDTYDKMHKYRGKANRDTITDNCSCKHFFAIHNNLH